VTQYRAPRLLEPEDTLDTFRCSSSEQTSWVRRHARQSVAAGSTRVFVVTPHADHQVVAYYAWCMAQIDVDAAPERLRRGAGRYPQPVALLARLGVDERHEGKGLGAGLLADAVIRVADLGEQIGCRGLLIHAETDAAREFYRHLLPELQVSPTDPLHLVVLMKDIRRTLRALSSSG
jgi:GNAT superfamily N-acetyltransferase